jgi:alpha-L-rhamnosidase
MHGLRFLTAAVPAAFLLAATNLQAALKIDALRCENLVNPAGIDVTMPRLSWVIETAQRNTRQSACEILVASSAEQLAHNIGDLWDSGKLATDESVLVPYAGQTLRSREACFWKVRVWDAAGQASAWSQPASWSMGILNPDDWHAQWIGLDGVAEPQNLAGTSWIWSDDPEATTNYFRRVITLPAGRPIQQAIFEFTGENDCRGWIGPFDLGARNSAKAVRWNDITTRLEPGQTYVFGLTGHHADKHGAPAGVIGKLTIRFVDGETWVIPTDDQWKVSATADGDWNAIGYDASQWGTPKVLAPAGAKPWGETHTAESRRLPARYLRKEFPVSNTIARATVSFSGLGLSELYLNGEKIGDAVLSPAFAQYDKRDFYVTYDVTKQLQPGANALGVTLGNGRFYADRSKVYTGTVTFGWPKLLLNLRIEYADGTASEVVSDDTWMLSTNGPIQANNDYDGEEYDARHELSGWCQPGLDTAPGKNWQPAQIVAAPGGVMSAQMMQPIRVTSTIKPRSMKEIRPGVFIYDLGQNIAGWCRLRVTGPAGTQVTLRHAETLKPDGSLYMANLRSAEVTDRYTLRGTGGQEIWEPRFVSHGFRYVEVTGFPGQPDLESIEGRVVNDDLPVAGNFLCANDLLNRIYTNIVWGTRGNYRSMPSDCPQRDERQGWLGDRSEECKGEAYLFDIDPLYAKWRQDMADAQRTNGVIPDIAPAFWPIYSDNVTWPSSAIIIPSALERLYGDRASLEKNYPSARLWIEHMLTMASNNIISKDSYGDWCVPPEEATLIHSKDPARQTDKALLATSYFYHDLRLMEQFATELGKAEEAARWEHLAEAFKTAFNDKFLDRDKDQYSNGTQTSCVLPLAFGLVPEDMEARIFAHLLDKIEHESHGHIGTGLVGGQYLNRVLSDHGRPDLCYTIATQTDYPSWGYMVEHGATTIWELWNGNTADPTMNSGNHVMLIGDLVVWFYEYLAGIAPDDGQPGFKHIVMRPQLVGDLKFVKASHNSPYGLIASEWHRKGGKFDWRIEIPANTTATVYVPATELDKVGAGGLKAAGFKNGRAIYQIGSGKYHFTSK